MKATRFDFLAPAQAADEVGRLGAYRVLKVLGQGGMGMVFLAEDPRLGRSVALKAMRPEVAAEPGARERFLREARAIATLQHDNIISVYEVGEERGVPFIVMPLLAGISLEDLLRKKLPDDGRAKVPVAEILRIGREIASGLGAAHERGVIHRDIKPANIWLDATADGRVKLLDFGLARSNRGEPTLTQLGAILGTPAYMAPEQARAQKVDGRADLFSLGVVLYRLCTGDLPFHGPSAIGMLIALTTHEPPPPRKVNRDVPQPLSELVMKLLAKDPVQRISSAQEVLKEILAIEKDLAAGQAAADTSRTVGPGAPPERPPVRDEVAPAPRAAAVPTISPARKHLTTPKRRPSAPAKAALARRRAPLPASTRRWTWPVVTACLLVLTLPLVVYVAATVNRVHTGEGTLVIDVDDPEVLVTVTQNNVKLYDKVKDRRYTLGAGTGVVEVYDKGGVGPLKTEPFTLDPGRQTTVQIRLEPRLARVETKVSDGGKKPPTTTALKVSDSGKKPTATAKTKTGAGAKKVIKSKGALPAQFKNSFGMEFVLVPRGTAWLGGGGGTPGQKPVHILGDFYLGKYTVTQGQWEALMKDNPSNFSRNGPGKDKVASIMDADLKQFPVENVSWADTQQFLEKLNASEKNRRWVYRLPTEAEWEYACRGGPIAKEESAFDFYFDGPTNDLSSAQANFNGNFPAGNASSGQFLERTTKVGSYRPNRLGIHDMHGNVWQWCEDAEGSARVFRGGSWILHGAYCRAASRIWFAPAMRSSGLGFRLARVPSGR